MMLNILLDISVCFLLHVTKNPTSSPATLDVTLIYVWNNGNYRDGYSAASEPYPLLACRGDCDNDDECDGSLICFQRSGYTPVPGCSGDGQENTDYCYALVRLIWD